MMMSHVWWIVDHTPQNRGWLTILESSNGETAMEEIFGEAKNLGRKSRGQSFVDKSQSLRKAGGWGARITSASSICLPSALPTGPTQPKVSLQGCQRPTGSVGVEWEVGRKGSFCWQRPVIFSLRAELCHQQESWIPQNVKEIPGRSKMLLKTFEVLSHGTSTLWPQSH